MVHAVEVLGRQQLGGNEENQGLWAGNGASKQPPSFISDYLFLFLFFCRPRPLLRRKTLSALWETRPLAAPSKQLQRKNPARCVYIRL